MIRPRWRQLRAAWLAATGAVLAAACATLALGWLLRPASGLGASQNAADALPLPGRSPSGPTLPPLAERRPTKLSLHNTTLVDNYAWLRNIDSDPAVARHLADENGYATSVLATLEPLRSALIGELSMPPNMDTGAISPCLPVNELIQTFWEDGDFIYWISYDSAQPNLRPHPIYRRRRHRTLSDDPDDDCICSGANRQPLATAIETVLDLNDVVANNATYVYVGVFEPSPFDPNLITYSLDLDGSERYTLHIHNLHLEGGMDRVIATNTYYSARWQSSHPDASTASHWLLFNSVDPVLGTPTSIWRACVWQCEAKGASGNPSIPHMLYHEKDIAMTVELSSSTDQAVVFIKVVGQITSELHLLLSPSLEGPATRLIARRTQGVVYDAEHHNGVLYVRTNLADRGNFALIRASLADLSERPLPESHSMFETVIPHSPYRFIEKIEVVAGHLVVWFWSDGLRQFCIAALERLPISCEPALLSNPDRAESQVYSLMPGTLEDIDARLFRPRVTTCMLITLSSFLTPRSTFAVSFKDLSLRHVHRSPTRAFDPNLYHQLRLWTTPLGQDSPNMRVPVSVVYRRDAHQTGSKPTEPRPTLLLAYGAYGGFQETAFDGDLFSLLDRGVLVAVCHPRGDGDLGAWWYTQGKYESKANTFADTRGCLMGLIDQGFAREGSIALKGRSAGGLVAGDAIRWMRDGRGPYANVVIAQVPFVDPIADLVDPSVPWTPFEWFEWGSPLNKTIFDAMLRYSPYLNIEPGLQPAALVTTGLHDPRVPFYEPAKFVAKLREFKPAATHESAPLLLRVYGAGHFSSQDGTSRIQELADWYSFVLKFIAQ
nr:hypothetical protein HK105_001288 [Polyrhizophydium stewartii]